MTAPLLASPPPADPQREPWRLAHDHAPSAVTTRTTLDGWACGLGDSADPRASARCGDIVPELMVELL